MIKIRASRLYRAIIFFIIIFLILCIINKLLSFNVQQSLICSHLCSHSSILTQDTLQFDSSYTIRHFPQFVCPQNFRNLADWVYGWPDQFLEHLQLQTKEGKVYPHLQNDFVLITGEDDISTPTHVKYLERSDSKIIHWFGQNGQYDTSRTNKFTHIPIGNLFLSISYILL
jgi:hypothetical protein